VPLYRRQDGSLKDVVGLVYGALKIQVFRTGKGTEGRLSSRETWKDDCPRRGWEDMRAGRVRGGKSRERKQRHDMRNLYEAGQRSRRGRTNRQRARSEVKGLHRGLECIINPLLHGHFLPLVERGTVRVRQDKEKGSRPRGQSGLGLLMGGTRKGSSLQKGKTVVPEVSREREGISYPGKPGTLVKRYLET